jgi:adenylate kinase family enzyme
MNNTKVNKFVLDKTVKYKIPCVITLSGLPGSGKTTCAKVLSKNLKVFIISNDFIRHKYMDKEKEIDDKERKKVEIKILLLKFKRILNLYFNKSSFVLDKDANSIDKFKMFELLNKLFKYQMIKIKINSTDDSKNLDRIKNRLNNNISLNEGVIGDNIDYKHCYSPKTYYEIKSRKPQLLEDDFFDYVITNDGDFETYLSNLEEICEDILVKKMEKCR